MWINPKYQGQVEQPQPPAENGPRLATFPRGGNAEMRVNLSTFEGKSFISLRVWQRNSDGAWWPTKKGTSVRIGEAAELAEVLMQVQKQGPTEPEPREDRPRFIDKGRPARKPFDPAAMPKLESRDGNAEFDEFKEG